MLTYTTHKTIVHEAERRRRHAALVREVRAINAARRAERRARWLRTLSRGPGTAVSPRVVVPRPAVRG